MGRLWPLLGVLLPALVLAAVDPGVDDSHWTSKYDRHFRKYAKHYFGPHVDWRWFKAQGIAESNLKPRARSRLGARGIMQILPSTFKEIKKLNPHLISIDDPKWNIAAGIYYDRQMYRKWDKGFSFQERLAFAFGSYNAGYGGLRKSYRKAVKHHGEVTAWNQVKDFAPRQTRGYVHRIRQLMRKDQ